MQSDRMYSPTLGGEWRLHEVSAYSQLVKKYLTATGQVNSELLAKTFNRSLVPPECRQQKSIAVLCEAYHRLLRSLHQATNESHGADRSQILQKRDTLQRPAIICV